MASHKLRPYFGFGLRRDSSAPMICETCSEVDPDEDSECTDDATS